MAHDFTPEQSRAGGVKSGISRRPLDFDATAKRAYNYSVKLMDIIAALILEPKPCDKCKRPPLDPRTLESYIKILGPILTSVQHRAWGQPGTGSKYGRESSLDDFAKLRREVERAKDSNLAPPDLPPPPPEWDEQNEDHPIDLEPEPRE